MLPFYLSLIASEEGKCRFEEIYYTYRRQMFALANSILRNEHDAEDAVHDVFYAVASSHMDVITHKLTPEANYSGIRRLIAVSTARRGHSTFSALPPG